MDIPPADYKPKSSEGGVGPFLAIIIIVVLFAAGGIYFLITQHMAREAAPTEAPANS